GVSCPAPGSCVAVGFYTRGTGVGGGGGPSSALVVPESGGTWSAGLAATPPATASATGSVALSRVACASSGNCVAVGYYLDQFIGERALLVTESGGTWARGTTAPNLSAPGPDGASSVACVPNGSCSVSGFGQDPQNHVQAITYSQTSSGWSPATEIPAPAGAATNPQVTSSLISCPASGACTGGWPYTDSSGAGQLMLANQSGGTWQASTELSLPSTASTTNPKVGLAGLTCAAAGDCVAIGSFVDAGGVRH